MLLLPTLRGRTTNKGKLHRALGASMTLSVPLPVYDRPIAERAGAADTFPKLLLEHARVRPGQPANREKDYGIWQSWSWAEVAAEVEALACGLSAMGFRRGDKLAIIGDNRPRLYWAVAATQALGGVPVPLYQDSIEKELAYIVDHAEARFAVVEDQEQVDKLLHIRAQCPRLEYIVYDDARGMRAYSDPCLISLAELEERGDKLAVGQPGYFDAELARGSADDVAIICYTSGTTGSPKGTMLTHRNMIVMGRNAIEREGLRHDEEVLAYLPMAWVGDHIFSYAQSVLTGFTVNCPESAATVLHDLKEIGPTYFFAPPRIWETILTSVMVRVEDCAWPKRRLIHFFLRLAQEIEQARLHRAPVPAWRRFLARLGRLLVYDPLRDNLGMRRLRRAYTAGEAIGPEIFVFFRAPGINVKQIYGMTEPSVFITVQKDGDVRLDTVGTPIPGVELRISPEG